MISNPDQLRINAFLKRFGCNRSECLTYIEALKTGTTTVQELSRILKRNRISVYYNVQQLIEKGLLFEVRKGKRAFISAANSDIFQNIIEKRYTELKSLQTDVEYITKLLNTIPIIKSDTTVVKLYEETVGFKKMLEESLQAENEIVVFSNSPVFWIMLGEEYYEQYFAKKAALGISSRVILPPCAFANKLNEKKEQYKIDLRILQQNQESESEFYLWNNTLAIKSLKEDKRSCTIIENIGIAQFFRDNIFGPFWENAKPIEKI